MYSNFILFYIIYYFLKYDIFGNTHPYEGEFRKIYTYQEIKLFFLFTVQTQHCLCGIFFLPPVTIFIISCFHKSDDNRPEGSLFTVALLYPETVQSVLHQKLSTTKGINTFPADSVLMS